MLNRIPGWLKRKRGLLIEIIAIVLLFIGVRAYQQRDLVQGAAIPVSGRLLNAEPINWQQYAGKPFVVHFWASWCPVCKLEQDSINNLAKDYPVISIASWSGNNAEVAAYLEENQLSFPVLVDEEGYWAGQYGIQGVPATFLVDKNGEIAFTEVGFTTEWGFRLRLGWLGI